MSQVAKQTSFGGIFSEAWSLQESPSLQSAEHPHRQREPRQILWSQRLSLVGECLFGPHVDLGHHRIGAGSDRSLGHGRDERTLAGRVARVDDNRQITAGTQRWDHREVEELAPRRIVTDHSTFTEGEMTRPCIQAVFGSTQPLVERRRGSTL